MSVEQSSGFSCSSSSNKNIQ